MSPIGKCFVFVGLEPNSRAYQLWDKSRRQIVVTGDAFFREDVFPATNHSQTPIINNESLIFLPDTSPAMTSPLISEALHNPPTPITSPADGPPLSQEEDDQLFNTTPTSEEIQVVSPSSSPPQDPIPPPLRSARTIVAPYRFGFSQSAHSALDHDHPTYDSALNGPVL